ncbi:hypothetical protein [Hyunsoonleella pacifica]|uniref:Uncharacterized protein n=1 Tax=Hyunsoonleella pacifica TaxID=1080224 RepID=A0A4V2JB14_9FLAO|nr:hypothetical protein [Hyunsoonleella pacifica]TBN16323.1 hypothetical protein EYD46_06655 [Hyunsoonleella pacifica]GGD20437.1 hypothetical protein GCM10011368_22940 [Hyunsoonleella pacifica]
MKNYNIHLLLIILSIVSFSYGQTNENKQGNLKIITDLSLKDNPKNWNFSKTISTSQKASSYKKIAKDHLKKNDNQLAMLSLMTGLSKTKKRGQIKKFKKLLTKDFVSSTFDEWSKEHHKLETAITEKELIDKIKEQLKLIHHLKYLRSVNELITVSENLEDYKPLSVDIKIDEDLQKSYKENKAAIAPYYYDLAQNLEGKAQTKLDWKKVSAYYRITTYYQKDYEDANTREKNALEHSIYTLNVRPEIIQSQKYRRLDKSLQLLITDRVSQTLNYGTLPHLKLFAPETLTDYSIHLRISDIDVQHGSVKSTKVNYDREIVTGKDDNGNEIKKRVNATGVIYSKESKARLMISLEIRNNNSSEIMFSKVFSGLKQWHDRWYKLNGDEDALTKKQKRLLPYSTTPQETPSDLKMIQDAVESELKNMDNFLHSNFLYEKGKVLY